MRFDDERQASAFVISQLAEHFMLVPEVRLRHFDGNLLRIDFAAVPRFTFHVPWFGIEIKRGYDDYNSWSEALRQAVDYRHSLVVDPRSTRHQGERPPWVFVFPDIRDTHDSPIYTAGAWGTERSHGKLKIGTIRYLADWRGNHQLEFYLSAAPVWRPSQGQLGGEHFGTRQAVGAR